jgi:hypothetical protein
MPAPYPLGVHARLRWRLLVVPRILLAMGVILFAVFAVVLKRRPSRPAA